MEPDKPAELDALAGSPFFLYGQLLAVKKIVLTVGLMVSTKPELLQELKPVLEKLRSNTVSEQVPEAVLLGIEAVQTAVAKALDEEQA